ncbi:MAG: TIR domain-containing protein, partial [Gammaproteobacteria bacterium]
MAAHEKKYYAFISYRHADNREEGRYWANWLHQSIETYEVPEDLVGTTNQRGEEIPARIYPVFRDEDELSADADLSSAIVRALDETRFLVVLCSPNAVASPYVAEEIDYLKKSGGSSDIIAAIIAGEPNASWDSAKQPLGFSPDDECFPLPLQFEYDQAGQRTNTRAEPIAADFRVDNNGRPEQGWTSTEAYRQHLRKSTGLNGREVQKRVDAYHEQQQLMLLKIISGILSVPLGELTQRDKEYQLELERRKAKKLRRWLSAVAGLAIVAVCAGIFAFLERQSALRSEAVAREQRDNALATQSRFLTDLASQEIAAGRYDRALLLALNATPGPYGGERPAVENDQVLYQAAFHQNKIAVLRNTDSITFAGISPDGSRVVTTSRDGSASVWSADTGEQLKTLVHPDTLYGADFSVDGRFLALAAADGVASIWDLQSGDPVNRIQHPSSVTLARMNASGSQILTASLDGDAMVSSTVSGDTVFTVDHDRVVVNQGAFAPDGRVLASASQDGVLKLSEVKSGRAVAVYRHYRPFTALTFDASGRRMLATSYSDAFLFQIGDDLKFTLVTTVSLQRRITSARFSADGSRLAVASKDGHVSVRSAETGEAILPDFIHESEALGVDFNPDGSVVVTGQDNGQISFWSMETGRRLEVIRSEHPISLTQFSANADSLLTLSPGNVATLWSPKAGKPVQTAKLEGGVRSIALSGNGKLMAIGSGNGNVALWQIPNDVALAEFDFDHQAVASLVFDPEGQRLLVALESGGGRLVSLNSLNTVAEFVQPGRIGLASFSPDGRYLVTTSSNGTARLWRVENGQLIAELKHEAGREIQYAEFNETGTSVVTCGDDDTVRLWRSDDGQPIQTFRHDDDVSHCTFSPDGSWVASSSWDGSVGLWSLAEAESSPIELIHDSPVEHVTFSPDGSVVLSASQESSR